MDAATPSAGSPTLPRSLNIMDKSSYAWVRTKSGKRKGSIAQICGCPVSWTTSEDLNKERRGGIIGSDRSRIPPMPTSCCNAGSSSCGSDQCAHPVRDSDGRTFMVYGFVIYWCLLGLMCLRTSLSNKVPVSLGRCTSQRLSENDHQQTDTPNGLA
jgi:hypothetical protein